MNTRISHLMEALGLSQSAMAQILRCNQSTVSRLQNGKPEQGLQAYVLDQLARERGLDHLTADAFAASQPPAPSRVGCEEAAPLAGSADAGEGGGTAPHLGGA